MAARRPEKLEGAADGLAAEGSTCRPSPANVADEDEIQKVVEAHRDRYGRLDVLVNNAGVGIGATVAEIETKRLDMQMDINLRSIVLFYRECVAMLRAAGAEHQNALVVNTAVDLRQARRGLAVDLLGHQARRRRLDRSDEQGTRRRRDQVDRAVSGVRRHADDRLRQGARRRRGDDPPEDIAESVRYLLKTSPACVVPEIMFIRPGDSSRPLRSERTRRTRHTQLGLARCAARRAR